MDNYEQKYKEALEKLQEALAPTEDGCKISGLTRGCIENIFPELKESEDEKIRKDIIRVFKGEISFTSEKESKKYIAWLEKQGEQPTDKVEPKFKVGDWLQYRYAEPFLVEEITEQGYCNGNSCLPFEWEDEIHPWTIQDAKDGDVLVASDGSIFLFAGVVDCACKYYVALTTDNHVEINKEAKGGYWETSRAVHPATKEQRDTLIKTMADAGYAFDFEKKELKKIEQNSADKLEPKFKVGDWITDGYVHCKITEILDDRYIIESKYNKRSAILFENKNCYHLWTINDAQDGDILSGEIDGEVFVFLFNQIQDRWIVAHGYYSETADEFIEKAYFGRYHEDSFSPATKEQRDLFFSKIKEAGYEWDTEKKELRKIESKTFDTNNVLPSLGNNRIQEILEDMGMLDDNGQCPYTAEEIFKAGIEYAYNLNREAVSNVKFDVNK